MAATGREDRRPAGFGISRFRSESALFSDSHERIGANLSHFMRDVLALDRGPRFQVDSELVQNSINLSWHFAPRSGCGQISNSVAYRPQPTPDTPSRAGPSH